MKEEHLNNMIIFYSLILHSILFPLKYIYFKSVSTTVDLQNWSSIREENLSSKKFDTVIVLLHVQRSDNVAFRSKYQ